MIVDIYFLTERARGTRINIGNSLLNTMHERLRLDAMLRHLGSDADLREFVGSSSEKVALVETANQRGLIAWDMTRGRYDITPAGWCRLAPSRRFNIGSLMRGATVGTTVGAVALAVLWLAADAGPRSAPPKSVVAAAPAQVVKAPDVTGAVNSAVPIAPTPSSAADATSAPPPAAAVEPEPTKAADEPAPEQRAQAGAKTRRWAAARKEAAAAKKEKARQRAAARRKRKDAARAWAANRRHGRHADYSANRGYGGNGSGNYGGGQNPWYAHP